MVVCCVGVCIHACAFVERLGRGRGLNSKVSIYGKPKPSWKHCLSVCSPGFSSSSFFCSFFWLNTRLNSRYAFSMRHAKSKIYIFKLFHDGFQYLWSIISKSSYVLSFFSDCSSAFLFYLKPAYPLKTLLPL